MLMPRIKKTTMMMALIAPLSVPQLVSAANVDDVLAAEGVKTRAAQQSQSRIDQSSEQTNDALQAYKQELKIIEDLKIYNKKLALQIERQNQRLQKIEKSISEVTVIQRQVTPLLIRMIDGLEQFVALDIPFHEKERQERIGFLRDNLDRSDLTVAEKFRQVLEAYKIENEYGRKIDEYKDSISIDGQEREVTMLQVGRIALLYQTNDAKLSGAWDKSQGKFVALSNDEYRDSLQQGIRIAKKQASIDILNIPVAAAEAM
jgi:hypothetical protein